MRSKSLFQQPVSPRPAIEPVLPLINVVFLLLIFFLMTGKLQRPEIDTIAPPEQLKNKMDISSHSKNWLYLFENGEVVFRGKPLIEYTLLKDVLGDNELTIFADAKLKGSQLDKVLLEIKNAGIQSISLVTERPSS